MASVATPRSAAAAHPRSTPSKIPTNNGQTRRSTRPIEPLSERTTTQLIRKILVPNEHSASDQLTAASIKGQLPVMTGSEGVDFQVYALIAIIVRDSVQSWYGKITPDETFTTEIVEVLAHVVRVLGERLKGVDMESLVLDEIPDLLERHIVAYRASKNPVTRLPIEADHREIYHSLFPLPAMSPVPDPSNPNSLSKQSKNEARYRKLLIQGMLTVVLKTEDLQNPCLTSLVGEIISETLMGNLISNKLSQPWMLWELLIIISNTITGKKPQPKEVEKRKSRRSSRPSTTMEPFSQETATPVSSIPVPQKTRWSFQHFILLIVQWGFAIYSFIREVILMYKKAKKLPSRLAPTPHRKMHRASVVDKVPIATFKMFSLASTLIELEDRMPWLSGNLAMVQWTILKGPWRIGALDGILDRYLSTQINKKLFDSSRVPGLLVSIRGALYPNNMPGKPGLMPPKNATEEKELRLRAATSLSFIIPKWMLRSYYCGGAWRPAPDLQISEGNMDPDRSTDERVVAQIEESIVDVFSDAYCNKHLMYSIVELVLVRLMPELSEKGVEELRRNRLGV